MDQSGKGRRSIVSALRWAMLFSVGSVLVLQEKMEEFAEQAVEKGQEAQKEGRKLVQEMRSAQRKKTAPRRIDALDVRINEAFKRFNVPTQQDIDLLNKHIVELSEHIDQLQANR